MVSAIRASFQANMTLRIKQPCKLPILAPRSAVYRPAENATFLSSIRQGAQIIRL